MSASTTMLLPVLLILSCCVGVGYAIVWSPNGSPDGGTIFVCEGSDVILDWTFTPEAGDEVVDVEWYFQREGGSEATIAGLVHGHFFSDLDRVEHVPLGGLKVKGVKASDVGLYSFRVNYRTSSGFFVRSASIHLQLTVAPVLSGGHVTIRRQAGAVMDNATGQWSSRLECGQFQNLGNPPVTVQWTTPSGAVFNDTQAHNGSFYFYMTNSTQSGDYSCAIADTSDAISCATVHELRGFLTPAAVSVDSKDVLLDILLAEKGELTNKVEEMTQQVDDMTLVTQHLRSNVTTLTSQLQSCSQQVGGLTSQLQDCMTPRPTAPASFPLGHRCDPAVMCPAILCDANMTCQGRNSSDGVCVCDDTHYPSRILTDRYYDERCVLIPRLGLNETCDLTLPYTVKQCSDQYSGCNPRTSTCMCMPGLQTSADGRSCLPPPPPPPPTISSSNDEDTG